MFKSLKRIVYHVNDLEKAKQWYSRILNTQPIFDSPFTVIFIVDDCSLPEESLNRFNLVHAVSV